MTARNYLGQLQHTVHRAIMWSDTQGDNWTAPYFCPDLPSPVENGDIILGANTPKSLGIGQPLFLSHPHSEYDRANGTLLMSFFVRWCLLLLGSIVHGCLLRIVAAKIPEVVLAHRMCVYFIVLSGQSSWNWKAVQR